MADDTGWSSRPGAADKQGRRVFWRGLGRRVLEAHPAYVGLIRACS
jgi:hypothetical protein